MQGNIINKKFKGHLHLKRQPVYQPQLYGSCCQSNTDKYMYMNSYGLFTYNNKLKTGWLRLNY